MRIPHMTVPMLFLIKPGDFLPPRSRIALLTSTHKEQDSSTSQKCASFDDKLLDHVDFLHSPLPMQSILKSLPGTSTAMNWHVSANMQLQITRPVISAAKRHHGVLHNQSSCSRIVEETDKCSLKAVRLSLLP